MGGGYFRERVSSAGTLDKGVSRMLKGCIGSLRLWISERVV